MQQQFEHYDLQIKSVEKRQNQILEGFMKNKETIIGQTQEITKGLLDSIQMQLEQNNQLSSPQDGKDHILKLENKNNKLLNE